MSERERQRRLELARCVLNGGHYWSLIAVDVGAGVVECIKCHKRKSIDVDGDQA